MKYGISLPLFLLLCGNSAWAVTQQDKMRGCHFEAGKSALQGEERKQFLSKCLKKEHKLKTATLKKLEGCHQQADGKKLEDKQHSRFVSSCLKKS